MQEEDLTLTWFQRWVLRYVTLFGLTEAEGMAIASWENALAATEGELAAATAAIAENPGETLGLSKARVAGKLAVHLDALRWQLRRLRTETDPEAAPDDPRGTCAACGGSGMVVVPHLHAVKDGDWFPLCKTRGGVGSYYTMAVLCGCALGKWVGDHIAKEESRPMRLETYQRLNPRWQVQLLHQLRGEKAYLEAALDVDGSRYTVARRRLDETLRRLKEQCAGWKEAIP